MRFATLHQISLEDLVSMADATLENTITDMDFLETLARHKCILVPPYVVQTSASGKLRRITPLIYGVDGQLDKPRILVALARAVRGNPPRLRRFEI
jgi:hypothetical protein